jgi:hypothetical protein
MDTDKLYRRSLKSATSLDARLDIVPAATAPATLEMNRRLVMRMSGPPGFE